MRIGGWRHHRHQMRSNALRWSTFYTYVHRRVELTSSRTRPITRTFGNTLQAAFIAASFAPRVCNVGNSCAFRLERSFLPRVPELSTTWGLPGVPLPTKGSRERNSGGGVNQYAVSLLLATTSLAVMDIGRSRNTAIKPRYRGALETTGRPVCEFRQLPVCASAHTRTGTSTRRTI